MKRYVLLFISFLPLVSCRNMMDNYQILQSKPKFTPSLDQPISTFHRSGNYFIYNNNMNYILSTCLYTGNNASFFLLFLCRCRFMGSPDPMKSYLSSMQKYDPEFFYYGRSRKHNYFQHLFVDIECENG